MAGIPISPETLKFIGLHIESVEQLEILCLVAESPSRAWSVPEAYRVIQSTENSIGRCLEKFAAAGLVAKAEDAGFRFLSEGTQAEAAAELVKTYRERRLSIIEAIYSRPTGAVRSFADAFRIRKEK